MINSYRKKPVVIEAFQLKRGALMPQWFIAAIQDKVVTAVGDGAAIIKTLEGDHRADIGDWIIQGVKGELYPCKPDIFEMTYEKVEK